ncbi:MAG: hypothetical protein JWN04_1454 [Myxococcaceae bacterium]|nr:hypothetical protein [Myxococcaceae bacterium]
MRTTTIALAESLALALTLVSPISPQRASAQATPLRAYSWQAPRTQTTNITPMLSVGSGAATNAALSQQVTGPVVWLWAGGIFASNQDDAPAGAPAGGAWKNVSFTHAKAAAATAIGGYIEDYKANGGVPPAFIAMDVEDSAQYWAIPSADNFAAIWSDPNSTAFRGMLSQYSTWQEATTWPDGVIAWDQAADHLQNEAMNESLFETARGFWQNIALSNYDSFVVSQGESTSVRSLSTFYEYSDNIVGTHMSPSFYGYVINTPNYYGGTAFDTLRWEVNRLRQMRRSSSSTPIWPWLAFGSYSGSRYANTAYYRELVFHVAMNGASGVLYWNPTGATADDDKLLDESLTEINARFSTCARAQAITTTADWNSDLLVSSVQVGTGVWHWRVTVKPDVTQVRVLSTDTLLPVAPGEAGVWFTTASASVPSFQAEYTGGYCQ